MIGLYLPVVASTREFVSFAHLSSVSPLHTPIVEENVSSAWFGAAVIPFSTSQWLSIADIRHQDRVGGIGHASGDLFSEVFWLAPGRVFIPAKKQYPT